MENYKEKETFEVIEDNSRYFSSGFKYSKSSLLSESKVELNIYPGVYTIPGGFVENFMFYSCVGRDRLNDFSIKNRFNDATANGLQSKQLYGCNEKVEFTVDIAKLEK